MISPIQQFRDALASAGVILATGVDIIPDGQLHRAKTSSDKAGQCSAWYRLHLDAPIAGAGGDWRQGVKLNWTAKRQTSMTSAERAELAARIQQERAEAQKELERRHNAAAAKAARIWQSAASAAARHPYLDRKGIAPGIARQSGGALILPVMDFTGTLHGLQFIAEDGGKRFISGMAKQAHFIPSGLTPSPDRPLWITEGWATASTLAAMRQAVCVIAALDAGNLLSVACEARNRWPGLEIVICPDFDTVGRQKGQEAAEKARARIMKPDRLHSDLPPSCTDWNDWACWRKSQEVRA
ncbi:MAG: toprim domain-containing protein [Acidithiobacillus sp.]